MSDAPSRSLDEILGPGHSLDDILGPAPEKMTEPLSGVAWDDIASGNNPIGHTLNLFGQGFKQGWGAQPYSVSPETEEWMRKAGLWNQHQDEHATFMKTLNEAVMRPGAMLFNVGERALSGLYRGIGSVSPEAGAAIEAFPAGRFTGLPARIPVKISEARSLGVIGEGGEAGWKGTVEPTPETAATTAEVIKSAADEARAAEPGLGAPPIDLSAPAQPVADIHATARQIAPDTFAEYDALAQRRAVLTRQIDDLAEQRNRGSSPEIAALDRSIQNLRAGRLDAPPNERAGIANRITELEDDRAKLVDALPKIGDTPAMAEARRARQEADYRMRDLSPNVSAAYRDANELGVGPETPPVAAPAEPPIEPILPPEAPRPIEPRASVADIKGDVSQKLIAAGRPAEEADAAASLVQSYYEARAARFAGAKGTAQELYADEAPAIVRGVGGRAGAAGRTVLEDGRATIALFGRADASTFIHETGHQWLDQFARDAEDARAPQGLRDDASAVRKWLGAEETGELTTRQHEKFARGFERYMMEGHAPSQALADVFVKFKEWLTAIYQAVAKLRAPITDDIRHVFDRMLATEGERPVIAAEREVPKTTADAHEALVDSTAPEDAAPVADRIRAEILDEAAKNPEVADEISNRGPAAEAGRGSAESDATDRNATAPEPAAGGNAVSREPGTIEPGGGGAATQGVGILERPGTAPRVDRGASAPSADTSTAVDAAATIPWSESPLIDKAGNIRLDNLNTPADVNLVLREAAEQNGDFIEARRGVISDAEVLNLADALGMDAKVLDARKLGEAFNAEQVIAARKLLIQSATAVRDAMVKAAVGTDEDVMAYAMARDRHMMVQEQVSGITAEAGRALRAFRALEGQAEAQQIGAFLEEATGRTLYQLRREAQRGAELDTPQKVSKLLNDTKKPTYLDMAVEFWINSLLAGPKTHLTNILSNSLVALYSVPETALASGIGFARDLVRDGNAERVRLGEAGQRVFALAQGAKEGIQNAVAILKDEALVDAATKLEQRRYQAIPGPAGKVIRTPGRMLAAEDAIFKGIAYRQELNALAYRQAMAEGVTGETAFAARVADLAENPTEEMMKKATQTALYQTFNQNLGPTGRVIQSLANSHPLIRFVIPFIRTPLNIVKYAQERSLLGVFSREVRANLSGVNGEVARDTQIARMALGTSLSVTAGYLAAQGLITGSGPTDQAERATRYLTGWQPYSVRIGETYYGFGRMEPLGTLLGVAADMYEVGHAMNEKDSHNVASMILASVAKNMTNKTWLSGPSALIQAVTDPDRYGQRYVQQLAGSVIPAIVAQAEQIKDPYLREARTVMDAVKSRIPVLSEGLFLHRDVWGNPIARGGVYGPIAMSAVNNDPVNQALLRLQIFPARIERKIRGVELTDQQYDDLARTAGRMTKQRLDALVDSPAFLQMPTFVQHEQVNGTIRAMREAARARILMENPSIWRTATEEKKALIHGASPREGREMLRHQVAPVH